MMMSGRGNEMMLIMKEKENELNVKEKENEMHLKQRENDSQWNNKKFNQMEQVLNKKIKSLEQVIDEKELDIRTKNGQLQDVKQEAEEVQKKYLDEIKTLKEELNRFSSKESEQIQILKQEASSLRDELINSRENFLRIRAGDEEKLKQALQKSRQESLVQIEEIMKAVTEKDQLLSQIRIELENSKQELIRISELSEMNQQRFTETEFMLKADLQDVKQQLHDKERRYEKLSKKYRAQNGVFEKQLETHRKEIVAIHQHYQSKHPEITVVHTSSPVKQPQREEKQPQREEKQKQQQQQQQQQSRHWVRQEEPTVLEPDNQEPSLSLNTEFHRLMKACDEQEKIYDHLNAQQTKLRSKVRHISKQANIEAQLQNIRDSLQNLEAYMLATSPTKSSPSPPPKQSLPPPPYEYYLQQLNSRGERIISQRNQTETNQINLQTEIARARALAEKMNLIL